MLHLDYNEVCILKHGLMAYAENYSKLEQSLSDSKCREWCKTERNHAEEMARDFDKVLNSLLDMDSLYECIDIHCSFKK